MNSKNEEDPYIARIKRSGCYDQHEKLQECYYEKKDWRQCREEMQKFRECFSLNLSSSAEVPK